MGRLVAQRAEGFVAMHFDAYDVDDDWLEVDDLGPLGDCPVVPDTVKVGWVWEPFADGGPKFLAYAQWREFGRPVEVTYDDGASITYY